jgi:predicted secreted protein
MAIIHGKDIKILNSSSAALIAAAKSCTIHRHADAQEVASASDATSKHYIAGRKEWSIDLAHLISTAGVTLQEGQTYNIKVKVGNTATWTGTVLCVDCDIQATTGNLSTGSIKLLGNGPLNTSGT